MGEDPDRIRREIEATRDQMSETVDAIGYKADVPARAKESIADRRDSAKEKIMGATDSLKSTITGATDRVSEATPSTGQVKRKAKRGAGLAQENPLGLAIGSVAVGFVVGLLLPSTRVEDERLGELSDDVIDRAKETGQEALERGKSVAQEAVQSAQETAQESGRQHAEELKQTAQEKAQETKPKAAAGHD